MHIYVNSFTQYKNKIVWRPFFYWLYLKINGYYPNSLSNWLFSQYYLIGFSDLVRLKNCIQGLVIADVFVLQVAVHLQNNAVLSIFHYKESVYKLKVSLLVTFIYLNFTKKILIYKTLYGCRYFSAS